MRLLQKAGSLVGVTLLITVGALVATSLVVAVRRPQSSAFLRGDLLYRDLGCVACHGPDGIGGVANPGSGLGEIPALRLGAGIKAFVRDESEIREWILDGAPRRFRTEAGDGTASLGADLHANPGLPSGLIRMPAYRGVVSEAQLDDLLVFIRGVAALERPLSPGASAGRQVAIQMGCFGCHGIDGRGASFNPQSFKGYIPPWDSEDFDDLVRDERELRSWILDGGIPRLESDPMATFFTDRQVIQMPAYRDVLVKNQLVALIAYIRWLRAEERQAGEQWVDSGVPKLASLVERGEQLYRKEGCVICHGPRAEGGLANPNAFGSAVPSLNDLAEKMELFGQREIDALVGAIEEGRRLEALTENSSIPRFDAVLSQYRSYFEVILAGSHPRKKDRSKPAPPLSMPSWQAGRLEDRSRPVRSDIDALIAYLLTLHSGE